MGRIRRMVAIAIVAVVTATTGVGMGVGAIAAAAGTNVVANGDFETGTFSGWTSAGAAAVVGSGHSGSFGARLGGGAVASANSSLEQVVTVPVNATLSFWYQPHCSGTLARDQEQMQLRTVTGATLVRVLNVCSNSGQWTKVSRSLAPYRNMTVQLWFNNHDDNLPGTTTFTLFDEVSLTGPLAANDFSISASPGSVTVAAASSGTSTISTAVTSGTAQSVSLSAGGLPAGASASFNPASVVAGGTSTLTLTTSASTPAGTSTITVTGTGASATHATTVSLTVPGAPPPGLVPLSHDGFTDPASQHATQVEPDTLSHGATLVSAFQVGRFSNGGSDDIGWATSTDNGRTWSQGLLPGLTIPGGGGTWARASDPSVAYDAKHGVWLIASLILDSSGTGRGVAVNQSADGLTWSASVNAVTSASAYLDKDWIVCDGTVASPNYGHCYVEYDNNSAGNLIGMITSTDGGLTWSAPLATADSAHGLGGQPLVQPNGTVVVPYLADGAGQIRSFASTNGGTSWASSVLIATSSPHVVAAGMRTSALPSAEIDAGGTVYVAWQDCRFRSGCSANDIVLASSSDATVWSAVRRVPIDAATSGVDHFIPGLAVDRSTSGGSAHLGLYYYYYPSAACSRTSCQLDVGFVSSGDGGVTWSAGSQVAGPMSIGQIASTTEGAMVGDYMSASFVNGRAYPAFAVGGLPSGSTYNESMFTVAGGLAARGGAVPADVWSAAAPGIVVGARPPGGPPPSSS